MAARPAARSALAARQAQPPDGTPRRGPSASRRQAASTDPAPRQAEHDRDEQQARPEIGYQPVHRHQQVAGAEPPAPDRRLAAGRRGPQQQQARAPGRTRPGTPGSATGTPARAARPPAAPRTVAGRVEAAQMAAPGHAGGLAARLLPLSPPAGAAVAPCAAWLDAAGIAVRLAGRSSGREHAELVALRVGEHDPAARRPGRCRRGPPRACRAGAPRPADVTVRQRRDVHVQPVLHRSWRRGPAAARDMARCRRVPAARRSPASVCVLSQPVAAAQNVRHRRRGCALSITTAATGPGIHVDRRGARGRRTRCLPGRRAPPTARRPARCRPARRPARAARSISAAWCSATWIDRSRWTRFLTVFVSLTGTKTSGSASGPG